MAGHGGAPPQYNSFTSPRSAAPPQPFDANGEPQQGFFPDAGAPPPPYQPPAQAPATNADGKVWGARPTARRAGCAGLRRRTTRAPGSGADDAGGRRRAAGGPGRPCAPCASSFLD